MSYHMAKLTVEHKIKKTKEFCTLREAAMKTGVSMDDLIDAMRKGWFENERWKVCVFTMRW